MSTMIKAKKCLKCREVFVTVRPREQHLCENCAIENAQICEAFAAEYAAHEPAPVRSDW